MGCQSAKPFSMLFQNQSIIRGVTLSSSQSMCVQNFSSCFISRSPSRNGKYSEAFTWLCNSRSKFAHFFFSSQNPQRALGQCLQFVFAGIDDHRSDPLHRLAQFVHKPLSV